MKVGLFINTQYPENDVPAQIPALVGEIFATEG
jgi:hypothetical protein